MKKHLPNFFSPRVLFFFRFFVHKYRSVLGFMSHIPGRIRHLDRAASAHKPLDVLVVVRNVMEPKSKPGFWKEIDVLVSVGKSRKFGDE